MHALADCTVVLDRAGRMEAFTDNRIAQIARSERATLSQHQTGSRTTPLSFAA